MSIRGGPLFTFSLPGGRFPLSPCQLCHCWFLSRVECRT